MNGKSKPSFLFTSEVREPLCGQKFLKVVYVKISAGFRSWRYCPFCIIWGIAVEDWMAATRPVFFSSVCLLQTSFVGFCVICVCMCVSLLYITLRFREKNWPTNSRMTKNWILTSNWKQQNKQTKSPDFLCHSKIPLSRELYMFKTVRLPPVLIADIHVCFQMGLLFLTRMVIVNLFCIFH